MKALLQRWKAIEARYLALSRRERLMVSAALVLGPLLIGNALFLEPLSKRAKALETGIARQDTSLAELQAQILVLGQQLQSDPDAAKKAELAGLEQARTGLDEEIQALGAILVRPAEMNEMLGKLLAKHTGLRLISLKTMAPRSVLADDKAGENKEAGSKEAGGKPRERLFDLFLHGVELRLEGSYGELMAYVTQLEQQKSKLMLEQLNYRVVEYPKAEMSLVVYTLSPDRAWLSL